MKALLPLPSAHDRAHFYLQVISWLAVAAFRIGIFATMFQHVRDLFPLGAFVWVSYGAACTGAAISTFCVMGIQSGVSSFESYATYATTNAVTALIAAFLSLCCAWLARPGGGACRAAFLREAESEEAQTVVSWVPPRHHGAGMRHSRNEVLIRWHNTRGQRDLLHSIATPVAE